MQTKKRKTSSKPTPMEEYKREVDALVEESSDHLARLLTNIRLLKIQYFQQEYKKHTKVYRWFYRLKSKQMQQAVDNMVAPYFDRHTVFGKNPGDAEMRTANLKALKCPFLK
jgi:hypothetical protein